MSTKTRSSIKQAFNGPGEVEILVLSYLTSNEGLNLHPQCRNSVMIEQGHNYAMEHQAWSRVRRIGQKNTQFTNRLVNLDTIDLFIENAQRMKQSPMLYAFGILTDANLEDDVNAGQVYDTLIGRIPPQILRKALIGQAPDEGGDNMDLD